MHTLLFDIDGTLINTGGAGGGALRACFCEEFSIAEPASVSFSGRTDRAIATNLFDEHDIEDTDENWRRLRDGYIARLSDELPLCKGRVLPGVTELLESVRDLDHVAVGLLTGNVLAGAKIKLEYYGLFPYFSFGGYGDTSRNRDDVARLAVDAARAHLGDRFREDRVWVIGDTPHDITCARAINARVVAVATGIHSSEELAAGSPDELLDDLSNTDQIRRLLVGA
jgi:phosphoglycolate phosphatase-like HAD superfamily hydrolase